MVVVAVAGGTGGVGRAIVDALNALNATVFVLSRQASEEKEKEIGARILAVDYTNVAGLTQVLEKNNVETVISTLSSMAGTEPEIALMTAADKSSVTKHYIPSVWGVPYDNGAAAVFHPAGAKISILAALEQTSLDYSAVYNGYFLDYFAPGVPSYMTPVSFGIDVANNAAGIPGTGDVPVVWTHTWDVAKLVAEYVVKAPKWSKEAYIIGDKKTFNEFVKLAEEVKGVKFTVAHDSVEDMSAGKVTELPSHSHVYPFFPKPAVQGLLAGMGLMVQQGCFDMKPNTTLNQEFPSVKARTVKEVLTQAYQK